jgi:hypothetical protein
LSEQVLVRGSDGKWAEPSSHGYADESSLQALLAEHPTLLPGVVGESAVCREFQSGVGPADIVIVDAESSITLVECKLAANREVRREVIGQVLDYASRLWQMPLDDFLGQWQARGGTPMADVLGDAQDTGLAALGSNLRAGRFRIILAVDSINDDLMRIVSYLNSVTNADTSVVAVEFRKMTYGDTEILMPRSFGAELAEEKAVRGSTTRRQWTVDEYLAWCVEHDPSGGDVVKAMLDVFEHQGWRIAGGAAASPSLNLSTEVKGRGRRWPIILYTDGRHGAQVEVRYSDFAKFPDYAESYLARTADVLPLGFDCDHIRQMAYRKRPNFLAHRLTVAQGEEFASAVSAWALEPVTVARL